MNASSESGLWALTITRGSTDVIRNWDETPPKFTLLRVIAHHRTEKNRVTKTKRAVIQQRVNPETSSAIIQIAHHALGPHSCRGHSGMRSRINFLHPVHYRRLGGAPPLSPAD